ncbi:hypothetical protein CTheo_7838 [Ceratobasidium theobromae]|uniref:Copia protein n=1 Tax=Ceratobasidium theobromae TaxID=1582974 RepID=A0A5N5QAE9_9AGAM|nr:hypothetical protein CTheo_7838 [Ceratobasidium theobromae]
MLRFQRHRSETGLGAGTIECGISPCPPRELRAKPASDLFRAISASVDSLPAAKKTVVLGVQWNRGGNIAISIPHDTPCTNIPALHPAIRSALSIADWPIISVDTLWSKVMVSSVPTRPAADAPIHSESELAASFLHNPAIKDLAITRSPRWVCNPANITGAHSSFILSFEDSDGSVARSLIKTSLFTFGAPVHMCGSNFGYEPCFGSLTNPNLPIMSTHSSNQQLSTPPDSPSQSLLISNPGLIDPTGVTQDFSQFNLNPGVFDVPLLESPKVSVDLSNLLSSAPSGSLQLGSTNYFFVPTDLQLYKQLSAAHTGFNYASLDLEDCLWLLSFSELEYPSPLATTSLPLPLLLPTAPTLPLTVASTTPISLSTPIMAMQAIISDKNFSITKLHGHEDYHIWSIQMQDMFQEVGIWGIVDGSELRPSTPTNQATWDMKNTSVLGAICWHAALKHYRNLGITATTLPNRCFTTIHMNEGDDLESHIKDMRKLFNNLNLALVAQSSDQLKELDFVRQLLVSLPESWNVLVSVINQKPEANDADGAQLSADIQSQLLTEYHHRKAQNSEKSYFARNRKIPGTLKGKTSAPANPVGRIEIICHNCNIPSHKRPDC